MMFSEEQIGTLQNNFLARWVYEQLFVLRDQTLGPGLRMHELHFRVYDLLLPALEKIIRTADDSRQGNVLTVPTPWHAALILDGLQSKLCDTGGRLIFRGQASSDWKIVSTISRGGLDVASERLRTRLFCDILGNMSFNTLAIMSSIDGRLDLSIPDDCYLAAAQHYGMKTDLIDFTSDPSVAVYFASVSKDLPPETMSSVYVFALDKALASGCEIVVPPPFVERLHLQRGFFIRHRDLDSPLNETQGLIMEVRFPSNYDFRPFQVIRRDKGIVELLATNSKMDAVLNSIASMLESKTINATKDEEYDLAVERACRELKAAFMDVYRDLFGMWANYVDAFEDMLYWTAYFTSRDSLSVDKSVMSHIVESNRTVTESIVRFYKYIANSKQVGCPPEKSKQLLFLAGLMESYL